MLVTLNDGSIVTLYDTEKRRIHPPKVQVFDGRHGLRLHVYDPNTGDASKKFVTDDIELQDEMMRVMRELFGHVIHSNTWVKPVVKRQEFWSESRARAIVLKDLQSYFGDAVTIRGNSLRYIYYVSDGSLENTPDAIGVQFRKPLVYQGLAYATIFDIAGLDPLRPGGNVVYWLTRKMWNGFHNRYRRVPKDFPWPTGFVCSHWCQRDGYGSYGSGIHIASMTQGQSVGRWATVSLRQYWMERQGYDIFAKFGKSFKVKKPKPTAISGIVKAMANAIAGTTVYGKIGLYCHHCGELLTEPYGKCAACGYSNSTYDLSGKTMCVACGKSVTSLCDCGDPHCEFNTIGCDCKFPVFTTLSSAAHKKQYATLNGTAFTPVMQLKAPNPIIIGG